MLSKIYSGTVEGVNGILVEVEVDLSPGLPTFATVGLPEISVRESKDRVKAAIANSGYKFPARRITVNLAPADLRKGGTGYDLPIALGVLGASGLFDGRTLQKCMVAGELSLDGSVRPVTGVLPTVMEAKKQGLDSVMVPAANVGEASVIAGIDVLSVSHLHQAVDHFSGHNSINPSPSNIDIFSGASQQFEGDFQEVKGQEMAKRALEISAAGSHNLLLEGPPGSGKTMLARRLPTILPDLTLEEALETSKVYSISGLNVGRNGIVTIRPFRSPHHNISDAGLIGGGQIPRPGEVSLANNGVLFLDELAEFKKNILEGLRQPLEDGYVSIARAASSMEFPARFILVAATNPCPCGYRFSETHECRCTETQVHKYRSRISGPLLDRIDMYVEVGPVPYSDLTNSREGESSAIVRERVCLARERQLQRFSSYKKVYCNSQMSSKAVLKFCVLDDESEALLEQAVNRLNLSARAFTRIKKIARTIADLGACEDIRVEHLAEAIQYRKVER